MKQIRKKLDTIRQCNKSYHSVKNCWFFNLKKAKVSWLVCNLTKSTNQLINLLIIGTLLSNLKETTASLPIKPKILLFAKQSLFLPNTLVSLAFVISFITYENNKSMPIDVKDSSSIFFKKILELDLDLLDIFSQEETSSLNKKF